MWHERAYAVRPSELGTRTRQSPVCASGRRRGVGRRRGQRAEAGLDLGAVRLEEGRQGERLAEVRGVLVGGEAGTVGGDLEEDAAGLAEVDRAEVETVNHRGGTQAGVRQALAPGAVLVVVGGAEGDVVDAADADAAAAQVGALLEVDLGAQAAGADLIDADRALRL